MNVRNILGICMLVGTAAQAQTSADLYPVNTTIRDYAKRDRLVLGGLEYISPAQLHENAGFRARLGADVQNSKLNKLGQKSDLNTPIANAAVAYGLYSLTLGLQASYLDATNEGKNVASTEDFKATKFRPEVAYTFGPNITAGVGVELSNLDVKEELSTLNKYSYEYQRPVAGLAFHTPKLEFGLAYAGEVQGSDKLAGKTDRVGTLSIATSNEANERAVYLPAMGTVYARGNLSDSFSLTSSVSMARYDGNVDGAVKLFDDYKNADRLAAKLLGTYWTSARSRVSLAAEYKGAATSAVGSEEAGLGYRLANLYGGTVEGILSLDRKTYLGLNASYMRGERDDVESRSALRYSAREESSKVSGFVTVKL